MKNLYAIPVIDWRFQIDYVYSKKSQRFEVFENNPDKPRLFIIFIKHREIRMLSDGHKKLFKLKCFRKIFNSKDFFRRNKIQTGY